MIVVTGADGQLGTAFRKILTSDAMFLTRRDLDIADLENVGPTLRALKPSAIINCAAYTAVDLAEGEPQLVWTVNAEAVGELAAVANSLGCRFVTFSTDYVFDGRKTGPYVESDETAPVNVYGQTKLAGEKLALDANAESIVIRTSWLMSGTHRSFLSSMIALIGKGQVSVVDDQRGRPTLVNDLAPGVISVMASGVTGAVHLTNSGEASWYGLAREIASFAGLDPSRVVPCPTSEFPTAARRPANSLLDSERIDERGVAPLRHYSGALEDAVREWLG